MNRCAADKLTLSAANATYFFTVRVLNGTVTETVTDTTRQHAIRQYPQTSIVDESCKTAAGHAGPVFSLRRNVAGELNRTIRVGLIPCPAGIMEITYNAEPAKTAEAEKTFNSLLRTFRSNENGKLDTVIRVLDKS